MYFYPYLRSAMVRFSLGLTEENTKLGILSQIGYFKSIIGDNLSNWGFGIFSLILRYQTHVSPIPNWLFYPRMEIQDCQLVGWGSGWQNFKNKKKIRNNNKKSRIYQEMVNTIFLPRSCTQGKNNLQQQKHVFKILCYPSPKFFQTGMFVMPVTNSSSVTMTCQDQFN